MRNMPTIKAMHITVVDHPLAASRLTLMRDERSDNATFRAALADLGTMLIYEASRHLDVEHFDTKTPVGIAQGTRLKNPPIIVPVIRAGLGMVDPALSMIPDAQVGFIGLARNEQTHEPVLILRRSLRHLRGRRCSWWIRCLRQVDHCCTPFSCLRNEVPPTSPPFVW